MNLHSVRGLFIATLAMAVSQPVLASEFDISTGDEDKKRPITIGLGVLYKDRPFRAYDDDEKINPIPIVLYEGESFFVRGGTLGWKFTKSRSFEVAAVGQFQDDGWDSNDASVLKGMDDRDPFFGVGGHVIWRPEKFGFKASAVYDITGNTDGGEIAGSVFFEHKAGSWFFKPSAALVWQSEDYIDYYYGVQRSEATSSRAAYSANSDITYRFQGVVVYQRPTSSWMFLAGVRYDVYSDEVDDSPITDDDRQLSAVGGIAYSFGK